ncbi:DNA-3-methyladenine glycosylase I [Marinagarivorans algicola]|uniref:DNA-3-methyladenine glycosylase I n=1 Tax=Marinagarivorans algicola TaxID=1513270 RepID=UPI0006B4448F|nr:DNA-3-methyladenine glycosylase I [Marinagarivorans algicola]
MIGFDEILNTAILHKGSLKEVKTALPVVLTAHELEAQSDAFYLSAMTRRIFRAGLKHSVIDAKWPAFEKALYAFNPMACAMMSDDKLDELMGNRELVRHMGKMKSIRINAALVLEKAREYGSFGAYLAQWPGANIVGLWTQLKKQGAQLGGMSGSRFLRLVGKDTFLLTDDVVAVLKAQGVVNKMPTSQKDLALVQGVFNAWQEQSGLPYSHISRIASMTAASWS